MPQEIALYGEFTIKETMMYFGWIFGMKTSEIMERLQFLLNFLDLPSQNRMVKNLSGGQQRRVSFAVALMHDPELLILDEPTVGVDPLLRQSIWNHLVNITKAGQKTVIITTHYIEEARQAHTIGLMRSGRLLAEESPQSLLIHYRCTNLEDVFLKLSRKQGTTKDGVSELNISNLSLSALAFGNKKDAPVYISQDSGVVGLNFHQSKEVLIGDHNGSALQVNSLFFHLYFFFCFFFEWFFIYHLCEDLRLNFIGLCFPPFVFVPISLMNKFHQFGVTCLTYISNKNSHEKVCANLSMI